MSGSNKYVVIATRLQPLTWHFSGTRLVLTSKFKSQHSLCACKVKFYPPEVAGGIVVQALVGVSERPGSSLSIFSRFLIAVHSAEGRVTYFPRFQ
jgi:hypothetical protein